jgi:membrane-associated protease RseP (regulator of RpoE activity)
MSSPLRKVLVHGGLFVITLITTTLAGTEWQTGKSLITFEGKLNPAYGWADVLIGLEYSIPFLLILTIHEFGHFFIARYHKIRKTLPYYIPVPFLPLTIGTLGALIRIKDRVQSNVHHFDIGIAGPLAGFVAALAFLFYGFLTLPPPEHIFTIHPEYEAYGLNYADHVYTKEFMIEQVKKEGLTVEQVVSVPDIYFGTNLLFEFFAHFVADPERVPNRRELMHYPVLLAGFLALFFTSLNLLPIGQLDGGHVTYGLFRAKGHRVIAYVAFLALLFYSGLGFVDIKQLSDQLYLIPFGILFYYLCLTGLRLPMLDTLMHAVALVTGVLVMAWLFPGVHGFSGWLLFGFLIGRFLGVQHPQTEIEVPLDQNRRILGWICLIIFILTF